MKKRSVALIAVLVLICAFCGCDIFDQAVAPSFSASVGHTESLGPTGAGHTDSADGEATVAPSVTVDISGGSESSVITGWEHLGLIPEFTDEPYVIINNNQPFFTAEEITDQAYELYGELDALGRCTVTIACIGQELMPTEDRGEIGQVKPTGWHTVKYDCVDGKYLYNRCHLIGFQLTGENANVKNLITGTRYMNVDGMLPFENMVADYLKEETENHVMYRVTPVFVGDDLVARGVLMEAYSVEDNGDGICFNVFCYNAQPFITVDYADGESRYSGAPEPDPTVTSGSGASDATAQPAVQYVLNTNTLKFHLPTCSSVNKISDGNKEIFYGSRDDLISAGYDACGSCKP